MILIAPTAFKGTVSAAAAADAMAAGARLVSSLPLRVQPLSDGGPGLLDAFLSGDDVHLHQVSVSGPDVIPNTARILMRGRSAIIESADACGWHLVADGARDVDKLNTVGVGELMLEAAKLKPDRIIVGLGGSATIDAGLGMRDALAGRHAGVPIVALADVDTTLMQAAPIFGPQKGATSQQIAQIEQKFAALMQDTGVTDFAGAGAAGGLAYGLRVFANAQVVSGSDWVLEETGTRAAVAESRVVVTGEGEFDEQSYMGKITGKLVELARDRGVPVLLVTGKARAVSGSAHVVDNGGATLIEADMERLVCEHLPALLHS